jgi:hypothetical protein
MHVVFGWRLVAAPHASIADEQSDGECGDAAFDGRPLDAAQRR